MMGKGAATALAIAFVVAAGFGLAYWQGWLWGAAQADIALRPDDSALVDQGEEIYLAHCAQCHGVDLQGQANWRERDANGLLPAPPHDETGHTWHHPDELLFQLTKYGPAALAGGDYKSAMPGYADSLSDQEIIAVLSFIKSTWPQAVRHQHDQINAR